MLLNHPLPTISKYQVVKVSPGGSHLGANWERAGASWSKGSKPNVILGFRVPTTIGLRKPPAHSPCSQLAPSSLPLLPEHPWVPGASWSEPNVILGPWVPGTFLEPQEAHSSLPLLPARSPHFQLAPLAPRACLGPWSKLGASWSELEQVTNVNTRSLGPWNLPGASGSPQLTPLAPSSLPSLPAHSPCSQSMPGSLEWAGSKLEQAKCYTRSLGPWNLPGASGSPQLAPLAPSSLPSLPAHSRDPGMLWEQGELSMYLGPYHLLGARG